MILFHGAWEQRRTDWMRRRDESKNSTNTKKKKRVKHWLAATRRQTERQLWRKKTRGWVVGEATGDEVWGEAEEEEEVKGKELASHQRQEGIFNSDPLGAALCLCSPVLRQSQCCISESLWLVKLQTTSAFCQPNAALISCSSHCVSPRLSDACSTGERPSVFVRANYSQGENVLYLHHSFTSWCFYLSGLINANTRCCSPRHKLELLSCHFTNGPNSVSHLCLTPTCHCRRSVYSESVSACCCVKALIGGSRSHSSKEMWCLLWQRKQIYCEIVSRNLWKHSSQTHPDELWNHGDGWNHVLHWKLEVLVFTRVILHFPLFHACTNLCDTKITKIT